MSYTIVDKWEYDRLKESAARKSEDASKYFQRAWNAEHELVKGLNQMALDVIEVFGLTDRYVQDDESMTVDTDAFQKDIAAAAEHLAETNKQSRGADLLHMFRAAQAAAQ